MNRKHLAGAVIFLAFAVTGHAQLGKFRDSLGKAAAKIPSPSRLLEGEPPITTSLEQATFDEPSMDSYPPKKIAFKSLTLLDRTENGGFTLKAGHYSMNVQSYCLKAGTHGPGGGDGYLFAPTDGPGEDAVLTIVRGSVAHPEIPQSRIQTLLWAIIARAKFEDLSPELKLTAAQLLAPKQIAMLNRGGLALLPGPVLDKAMAKLPPLIRQILEAEAKLRRALISANASFAELEEIAVLTGLVEDGPGSREVPDGRWSKHPDGYFVRYLPQGYSRTVLQLYVPKDSEAIGQEFDPATHIAVPGNTARQRLIQSGRAHKDT